MADQRRMVTLTALHPFSTWTLKPLAGLMRTEPKTWALPPQMWMSAAVTVTRAAVKRATTASTAGSWRRAKPAARVRGKRTRKGPGGGGGGKKGVLGGGWGGGLWGLGGAAGGALRGGGGAGGGAR